MKITDMLHRIATTDAIQPNDWKVEDATRWEVHAASVPDESGGTKMSYLFDGEWHYFADLELSPNYGLHEYVDRIIVNRDVPAWVLMPFMKMFSSEKIVLDEPAELPF